LPHQQYHLQCPLGFTTLKYINANLSEAHTKPVLNAPKIAERTNDHTVKPL
jgi:hypothetical protein